MAETQYWVSMDSYPPEYEDTNRLYKFYEHLMEEDRLTTTQCKDCKTVHWPPRLMCTECLSENLEWIDMPKTGKIYSYTVVWAGLPPALVDKAPVTYALVDFDNGVRMFTAIVDSNPDDIKTGKEVKLSVGKVDPDHEGRDRVIPYFTLIE